MLRDPTASKPNGFDIAGEVSYTLAETELPSGWTLPEILCDGVRILDDSSLAGQHHQHVGFPSGLHLLQLHQPEVCSAGRGEL